MTTNASRAPIDFDAFERELQPSSPAAAAETASETPKGDPLAELARIVGQDDPFRALLESRGHQRPAGQRIEPSFGEAAHEPPQAAPSPADAFDQYLATVEQSHQDAAYQDPAAFESDDRDYRNAAAVQPRPRGRLVQVGAGLGVLVLCVTGAFAWKSFHGGAGNSGPVTVLADKSPLKIAPEKADGVDIPDQNKQIYERNAKDGQIKVVNREEQPLDVAQAARAASRENGSENGNPGGVTPGGGLLTESLGEPRRIRTVAVKPDTPPPAMQQQREHPSEAAPESKVDAKSEPRSETHRASTSPIPTMSMPEGTTDGVAAPPNPSMRTARLPSATPAATPAKPAPTTTPVVEASAEVPAAAPASRRTLKRVASVAPETTASAGEPDAAASPQTTAAASTGSVGGFAVQIGVRNSEADARAAFQQMQAKHAQLAGKPELIRQAEVNGKSLYRVRVGPLSKAEATSLCNALKGAGSACFVAAN